MVGVVGGESLGVGSGGASWYQWVASAIVDAGAASARVRMSSVVKFPHPDVAELDRVAVVLEADGAGGGQVGELFRF